MKGFRDFVMRGNLVDLAVGFVIGAAFTQLVTALVNGFITPLVALIGGKRDFNDLFFTVGGTRFPYGPFVTALVSFLITAAVLYFLVVVPFNTLIRRLNEGDETPEPSEKTCSECASRIPVAARRCPMCTSELAAA